MEGIRVLQTIFGRSSRDEKIRIAQTAATEELSRLPETAAWDTGERERVAP